MDLRSQKKATKTKDDLSVEVKRDRKAKSAARGDKKEKEKEKEEIQETVIEMLTKNLNADEMKNVSQLLKDELTSFKEEREIMDSVRGDYYKQENEYEEPSPILKPKEENEEKYASFVEPLWYLNGQENEKKKMDEK
jgi:hypothetical protein